MTRIYRNNQWWRGCEISGAQRLLLVMMIALLLVATPTSFAFQATLSSRTTTTGFSPSSSCKSPVSKVLLAAKPSGAFFNQVPEDENEDADKKAPEEGGDTQMDLDQSLEKLMKERNSPSLASQPSTINGIPTSQAGLGFGFSTKSSGKKKKGKKQYIGIGEPDMDDAAMINRPKLNDVTKPEYDDQGYTLYANEETGEKSRVFEALVEYPCEFTMKIVGANEGTFVEEILQVVADSCEMEDSSKLKHKTRSMGKWISVTVQAPVDNAQMLYQLYENVDRDPRVKFKF